MCSTLATRSPEWRSMHVWAARRSMRRWVWHGWVQRAAFFSAVSRGFLGERLMRALAAEGVNTSAVQRNDAPTTLGLVGLDANRVPSYAFYGEGCADRQLTAEALAALPQGVRAIHLGSYASVVEPIA